VRYAAGALEVLFRGRVELLVGGGSVTATARDAAFGSGTITIYADVGDAPRRVVVTRDVSSIADGDRLLDAPLPAGTRRVAAVFRGVDPNGEPLVAVQEQALQ
jgi:hypothetical protein